MLQLVRGGLGLWDRAYRPSRRSDEMIKRRVVERFVGPVGASESDMRAGTGRDIRSLKREKEGRGKNQRKMSRTDKERTDENGRNQ